MSVSFIVRAEPRILRIAGWGALSMLIVLTIVAGCGGRTASGDSVGVSACDNYVARVQACAAKDPRIQAMRAAYNAQRDAWAQAARANAEQVRMQCVAAIEAFARSVPDCK
jgi:hypothetical protein